MTHTIRFERKDKAFNFEVHFHRDRDEIMPWYCVTILWVFHSFLFWTMCCSFSGITSFEFPMAYDVRFSWCRPSNLMLTTDFALVLVFTNFLWAVCLRWWPFHCIINYHFKEFGFINHFIWPSRPRSLKIQDSRTFYCQESIRVHRWVCKHFLVKRTYNSSYLYSTKIYLNKPMHRHWHEIQHEVAKTDSRKAEFVLCQQWCGTNKWSGYHKPLVLRQWSIPHTPECYCQNCPSNTLKNVPKEAFYKYVLTNMYCQVYCIFIYIVHVDNRSMCIKCHASAHYHDTMYAITVLSQTSEALCLQSLGFIYFPFKFSPDLL